MAYEPALDGVRALAVASVLLYHGQVSWVRGGFLGVDLFFVLSGYLITSLLLAERAATGSVDLREFWGRRARRLLPALFVVLLAVCAYSVLLAQASQRRSLRWDMLSTLGYVANWRMALSGQSYFAQYADPSPLRHMWSLGIEEQYYLAFPLLLVLWLRATSGRTALLRTGLLVGSVASTLLMLLFYQPGLDPSRVYFGTDTHAQGLLLGAALAVWAHERPVSARVRTYLRLGPVELALPGWGALGLVSLAAFLLLVGLSRDQGPWLYRGGFLLVVAVGTALVASVTQAPSTSITARALSWGPLRAIGLISYGLYLWHWPVYVVLDPERTGAHGVLLLALRLAVTLAVAALSYRFVELPVRRGSWALSLPGRRQVERGAAVAALVAVAALGSTVRTAADLPPPSAAARDIHPAAPDALRVFIIGDSVAWTLWRDFAPTSSSGLSVGGSTQLGCGLIAVPVVVDGQTEPLGPHCGDFDSRWPGEVATNRPDTAVLMLGIGEQFDRRVDGQLLRFGTPNYERFLVRALDNRVRILGGGQRPVVLVTVPCHQALESGVSNDPVIINDERRVRWLNAVQRRYVAAHRTTVGLVDLHAFLCADGYSNALNDVDPVRSDGVHFTPPAVNMIWRWLGPELIRTSRLLRAG